MDADRVIADIAAAQHSVLSRRQLLATGISARAVEHRLAQGRLLRVHPGVYRVAGHPPSACQALMAACLAAGPGATTSHRGAAFLHGLAGIEPHLEVSVDARRAPSAPGITVHRVQRLSGADTGTAAGIPCTRPARTLIDLASVVTPAALEVALDDALASRLVSCEYLRRRLDALGRKGRTGAGALVDLLAARSGVRPRSQSLFERRLLALMVAAGLPVPCTQYEVILPGGGRAFLDYAYPEVLLGLEADSYRHHSSRTDWARDRVRNNQLVAVGWRILPVTWDDLDRSADVIALIGRALKENPRYRGETLQTFGRGTMAAG